MNKIIIAAVAAAGFGLISVPVASADTPAPVAPGPHTFTWSDGRAQLTAALDCGPDCFSLSDPSERDEYRFDGARWVAGNGISTVDGITFTNIHGITATLT